MSELLKEEITEWNDGCAQTMQFIVTEDCNLRCKYCYVCHKKSGKVLSFETAKKFVDYFFSGKITHMPAVILDFIGGEPFLETKLIDRIVDYFKIRAFLSESDWAWNYRISITTNGVNYDSPEVQRFIAKNKDKISIGMTVDGTKRKHDMQRVFPDGSGSYDIIAKNIPLYLSQFAPSTKVTFAHSDISLLKESILHLWNLGITEISANVVNEDVWEPGDDIIFEEQLKSLADDIIDNKLYTKYSVSLFSSHLGKPLDEEHLQNTVCGAGVMLGVGPNGKIYPCMRYKDYSIESDKPELSVGDVDTGIDFDKVLRFRLASCRIQLDDECLDCDIAIGCSFCQGQSYDAADSPTNFQRAKFTCNMHKARVRANRYYFNRLYNETDVIVPEIDIPKKVYFVLSEDFVTFCEIENTLSNSVKNHYEKMNDSTIQNGLDFCDNYFYSPIFLHSFSAPNKRLLNCHKNHITHILSANHWEDVQIAKTKDYILVFDKNNYNKIVCHQNYIILNINWLDIRNLFKYSRKLFDLTDRINLNIQGLCTSELNNIYKNQLEKIAKLISESWLIKSRPLEFNKLTDVMFENRQQNCNAGEKSIALFPNGNFYICPHDYYMSGDIIGDVYNQKINVKNKKLYKLENSPLCTNCLATHCVRCAVANKQHTGEVNIATLRKCSTSLNIEYELSRKLKIEIDNASEFRDLPKCNYTNPYKEYVINRDHKDFGYSIIE